MTEPKCIIYRGVPMIEGWPEKIETAQRITSYKLNGKSFPRVKYGSEQDE